MIDGTDRPPHLRNLHRKSRLPLPPRSSPGQLPTLGGGTVPVLLERTFAPCEHGWFRSACRIRQATILLELDKDVAASATRSLFRYTLQLGSTFVMTEEQRHPEHIDGAVIRRAREAKGWSLRDLAKKLGDGTHFTTIGKIERGDIQLTVEKYVKLADALGLPTMALFTPSLGGGEVKMVPIYSNYPYNLMNEADKSTFEALIPIVSNRENLIGYGIFPEISSIVATAFSYVIIDLDDSNLVDNRLFCLHVNEDDVRYGCYRDAPARFEKWGITDETSEFTVGQRPFHVIGRVIQITVGVANMDTHLDGV